MLYFSAMRSFMQASSRVVQDVPLVSSQKHPSSTSGLIHVWNFKPQSPPINPHSKKRVPLLTVIAMSSTERVFLLHRIPVKQPNDDVPHPAGLVAFGVFPSSDPALGLGADALSTFSLSLDQSGEIPPLAPTP